MIYVFIGLFSGVLGGLLVVLGNFVLYAIEIRSRTKAMKQLTDVLQEASGIKKSPASLAKVLPFIPPNKLN